MTKIFIGSTALLLLTAVFEILRYNDMVPLGVYILFLIFMSWPAGNLCYLINVLYKEYYK